MTDSNSGFPLNDNFELNSYGNDLGRTTCQIIDLMLHRVTESSPNNFSNSTNNAKGVGEIRWNARAGGQRLQWQILLCNTLEMDIMTKGRCPIILLVIPMISLT